MVQAWHVLMYLGTSFLLLMIFVVFSFISRTLALFLSNIDNPSPRTVNGQSENGKCRPPFSFVKSIFQSTSKPVKIYNSSYLSTTIQQGSGLVDIYDAIKTTTIISPSELSLNDTIRKAQSYKVKVYNIGSKSASYKVSHVGAALATSKSSQDDQLLGQPTYSPDYAVSKLYYVYQFD